MRLIWLMLSLSLSMNAWAHPPCDHPEVWLAEHDRATVDRAYCQVCSEKCDIIDGRPRMYWRLNRKDALATYGCGEQAYLRHAIRGWHGHLPQTGGWRRLIKSQTWFRPRAPRQLPAAAVRNLEWLNTERARCKARPRVDPKHRQVIARFFAAKADGYPPLPKHLFVDSRRVDEKRFLKALNVPGLYRFGLRTGTRSMPGALVDLDLDQSRLTTVSVANGMPGVHCIGGDEACEGFEWSEFTFDRAGKLIAIHLTAAACPFVDVANANGEWIRVGEALRHLHHAALKRTQPLTLPAPTCNADIVEVRLSEEKAETTFLDALALDLDGQRLWPMRCADPSEAVCAIDGRVQRLRAGERDVYRFAVPDDAACRRAVLIANGHYVPD